MKLRAGVIWGMISFFPKCYEYVYGQRLLLITLKKIEKLNLHACGRMGKTGAAKQRCNGLDRFLRDVLHVLPEQRRFVFVQNHRSIIRSASHKYLDGNRIVPGLNFTMRNQVQVDGAISDTDKMHS